MEFHLVRNLNMIFDEPIRFLYMLAVVSFLTWLVCYKWKEKDIFLRQSLILVLTPLFSLGLIFGYIDEFRGYYEAYGIMVLLSIPTIGDIIQRNRNDFNGEIQTSTLGVNPLV